MNHLRLMLRRQPWTRSCWLHGLLIWYAFRRALIPAPDALVSTTMVFLGKITFQDGRLRARIATGPLRHVMEKLADEEARRCGGWTPRSRPRRYRSSSLLSPCLRRSDGFTGRETFYSGTRLVTRAHSSKQYGSPPGKQAVGSRV
jgi:hypothetical protein